MDDTRLGSIVSVHEFEAPARLAMSPANYDYVAGGAWDEITLAENETAWRRRRLRPRVLVDVSTVDPSTTFLGTNASMPIAVAPMAAHVLAHPEAEIAMAAAAAAAGVPFTLSTMSTRSMEDVAAAVPDGTRWFQLYTQIDPAGSRDLVERAAATGYGAIVLTVDLPILGYRERDRRSGFDLPGPHGNFGAAGPATHAGGVHVVDASGFAILDEQGPTGLSWADLATIRSWSTLPLVLKGILTAEDARLAVEHGADAIVVSNHGARQLDRVTATADVLVEIVDAVGGRTEVWVDGGIRRGLDVGDGHRPGRTRRARRPAAARGRWRPAARPGWSARSRSCARSSRSPSRCLGRPRPADLRPDHVSG